ncbi:hypothetical protein LB503_007097 [Fusarium chuoi]|nr:hypothetical protein LB503_007097 [Fusarium chuoi]
MTLNGILESSSIYFAMKSRPSRREYHWGLIITDNFGRPVLHHATNLTGSWKYEERRGQSAIDLALIVLVKASRVSNIIQSVPADGKPSCRTGADFTCRIWVKDALVELHEKGEISLANDIEVIETEAIAYAERYAVDSEQGKGTTVINGAFAPSLQWPPIENLESMPSD